MNELRLLRPDATEPVAYPLQIENTLSDSMMCLLSDDSVWLIEKHVREEQPKVEGMHMLVRDVYFVHYGADGRELRRVAAGGFNLGSGDPETLRYSEKTGVGVAYALSRIQTTPIWTFREGDDTAKALMPLSLEPPALRRAERDDVVDELGCAITDTRPMIPLGLPADEGRLLLYDMDSAHLLALDLLTLKADARLTYEQLAALYEDMEMRARFATHIGMLPWIGGDLLCGRANPCGFALEIPHLATVGTPAMAEERADEYIFAFRNGITWASTLADVIAAEGATEPATEPGVWEDGHLSQLVIDDSSFAGHACSLVCLFLDGRLSCILFQHSGDADNAAALADAKAALTDQYGQPNMTELSRFAKAVEAAGGNIGDPAAVEASPWAGWILPDDGTLIFTSDIDDDVGVMFLRDAQPEPAAQPNPDTQPEPYTLPSADSLRLIPAQWYDAGATYTITQNRHALTVTEAFLAEHGLTLDGMRSLGDVGLDTDIAAAPLPDAGAVISQTRVVSVSPDGGTLLLDAGGVLALLTGNSVRAVSVDIARSARSEKDGYKNVTRLMESLTRTGPGRAGVLWTPDGGRLLAGNATDFFRTMRNVSGLTWLDTQAGSLYIAENGGSDARDCGTVVEHAYSDSANERFYMTVYDSQTRKTHLRRYDMTGYETLCEMDGTLWCEGMGRDASGALRFLMRENKEAVLKIYDEQSGTLASESVGRIQPVYFSVTPGCSILSAPFVNSEEGEYQQILLADRDMARLTIPSENGVAKAQAELATAFEAAYMAGDKDAAPLQAQRIADGAELRLLQAVPTLDGAHALLACVNGNHEYSLLLMDTSDLSLTPVDISAFAELFAEKGPGFGYGSGRYMPGLCFTGGDRYVILPFANGDTVLCELVAGDA